MKKGNSSNSKRHGDREDLIGEHALGDLGQIILLFLFVAVWIADSFIFQYSIFISNYIPLIIRIIICLIVLIVSVYLARSGLKIVFGETREIPIVIRKGVFNIVRHPIYLSAILFYFGLLLFIFSIYAFIVWLIIIVFYHFISRYEEELLLKKFGSEYEKYINEVPMWIPRIK